MSRRAPGHRRLRLANSGKWYVAMTICFGVVAISSGNNVLYLLESLLLGGLILSGVLSERAVAVVEVSWRRRPTLAGELSSDVIVVKNKSRLPLFCLELGEWVDRDMKTRAFLPFLAGKASTVVPSKMTYEKRGEFHWDGVSFATRYPFGFAQKIRWVEGSGQRLIWPARFKDSKPGNGFMDLRQLQTTEQQLKPSSSAPLAQVSRHGSAEFSDGEIRPLQPGDDYRDAVWTLSAKRGEPVMRQRQSEQSVHEVILDLRQDPGEEFEKKVSQVAEVFYREGGGVLVLMDWNGFRRIEGLKPALDLLAIVRAAGRTAGRTVGRTHTGKSVA